MKWQSAIPHSVVLVLALCGVTLLAQPAGTGTTSVATNAVIAASCSSTHVQAAIDAAVNGGTVVVPAGTCTWSTLVTVPDTKGSTVRGAGIDQTVIKTSSGMSGDFRILKIDVAPGNSLTRLTAMTLDHDLVTCSGGCGPLVVLGEGVNSFRVDHVRFANIYKRGMLMIPTDAGVETPRGHEMSGVVDNNTFECPSNTSCQAINIIASPSWDSGTDLAGNLSAGWGRPFSRAVEFGSNKAIYIEDNTFDFNGFAQDGAQDGYGGLQMVHRFNTHEGPTLGWHGADSGGYRGGHWFEMYGNTMNLVAATASCLIHRSNTGIVFDNTCEHPTTPKGIGLSIYRARPETFVAALGQCDGTSAFDGSEGSGTNTQSTYPSTGTGQDPGRPCLDQPGWVHDENGGSGYTWTPSYFFNNSDGVGGQVAVTNYESAAGNLQNYLQPNREYFVYTATFDGTSGVGRGVVASRPATCTTGVGYWATDEGEWNSTNGSSPDGRLYKCTATNTWTLYYTPYTYPHPLRSGS
jgi:hypothetical protein